MQPITDVVAFSLSSYGSNLTWHWRFGNLKQYCAGLHVSDLKPGEVDHVDILLWRAEVI